MEVQAGDAGWQARACGNPGGDPVREFDQKLTSVVRNQVEPWDTQVWLERYRKEALIGFSRASVAIGGDLTSKGWRQQTIAYVLVLSNREVT